MSPFIPSFAVATKYLIDYLTTPVTSISDLSQLVPQMKGIRYRLNELALLRFGEGSAEGSFDFSLPGKPLVVNLVAEKTVIYNDENILSFDGETAALSVSSCEVAKLDGSEVEIAQSLILDVLQGLYRSDHPQLPIKLSGFHLITEKVRSCGAISHRILFAPKGGKKHIALTFPSSVEKTIFLNKKVSLERTT